MGALARPQTRDSRYYGKCLVNGQEVILKVTAYNVSQASRELHKNYPTVEVVLDILTYDDIQLLHRSRKPSLVGTPRYR